MKKRFSVSLKQNPFRPHLIMASVMLGSSYCTYAAQTTPNPQTNWAKTRELFKADQKAAKIPSERAALVAELALSLPKVFMNEWETDGADQVCGRLAAIKAVEATPLLAPYASFPFRIKMTENTGRHAVKDALQSMGRDVLPAVIQVIADNKLVRNSTNYRPEWLDLLTPDERKSIRYNPEGEVFVWLAHLVSKQTTVNQQNLIANEYEQKANNTRFLANYLDKSKDEQKPEEAKGSAEVPTLFASNNETRISQVLQLHYTLTDQLTPSTEAQVLTAIANAQKLKAFELAPTLCDKLIPILPPKVDDWTEADKVLVFNPKGRFSPAIAKASEEALRSMGRDAIPALLDAASAYGHDSTFQFKAMSIIFAAAGSKASTRAVIEQAAKLNDERAARLRAIIESAKKPLAQ